MAITVTPTGAALGAEVRGVDLRDISRSTSRRSIAHGWIIWCCCSAGRRWTTTI